MNLSQRHTGFKTAATTAKTTATVAVLLCLAPVSAQAENPWNPYPAQQAQPAPAPAPKPTYYVEAPATPPAAQATPTGPSRFAPTDLNQQLSAGPPRPPFAPPFGYQVGNSGPPPNFGGYGPPMGNNGWGAMPGNNYSPFGFW